MVFRRQNHITFIFIKTMPHDLLVQMAYCAGVETRSEIIQICFLYYNYFIIIIIIIIIIIYNVFLPLF